jgi:hypothetical protein
VPRAYSSNYYYWQGKKYIGSAMPLAAVIITQASPFVLFVDDVSRIHPPRAVSRSLFLYQTAGGGCESNENGSIDS